MCEPVGAAVELPVGDPGARPHGVIGDERGLVRLGAGVAAQLVADGGPADRGPVLPCNVGHGGQALSTSVIVPPVPEAVPARYAPFADMARVISISLDFLSVVRSEPAALSATVQTSRCRPFVFT